MTIEPGRFDPRDYPRGSKCRLDVECGDFPGFPVLLVRGTLPGPTLVATANVHGDEYEGVRAIFETFEALDPECMSGDFLAVPVVNLPAFWAASRTSPLDGANLARVFPGKPDGSASERVAYHLAHAIIARADFYLDLHSGGIRLQMPSMVGYAAADPRGRAAAEIFGAPVIWAHGGPVNPGRTISFAAGLGIPWLYTEARGAGRIHPEDLAMMRCGMRNLLRHLGVLPGEIEAPPIMLRLFGSGDTDKGVATSRAGFLLNDVRLLQSVEDGQVLGRLVTVRGELLETYRAPETGIVAMIREFPVVQPGEILFLLAQQQSG